MLQDKPAPYDTNGGQPKPQKIVQVRRYDLLAVKRLTSREEVDSYLETIRSKLYDTLEESDAIQII
jgi:hypothetical protein